MQTTLKDKTIELVECPRDAMQGWAHPISTETKVAYLRTLLEVGFPVLDFGSFVSPKAIPQMADTAEVLKKLDLANQHTPTKLLAIIANLRGAEDACKFNEIHYLGFPFSISETFQLRNTNSTRDESFERVKAIQDLCIQKGKELVIYLSMGFGNPYGDPYTLAILKEWAEKIAGLGIKIISLADTVGLAEPNQIKAALQELIPNYPDTTFGVHLHSSKERSLEKMQAALDGGCRRFDGALKGIGGCPMAGNDLVGNMDTELMIHYFKEKGYQIGIKVNGVAKDDVDSSALARASEMASRVFI